MPLSNKPASEKDRLFVRFWGVRGSLPTPSKAHVGVGGNTACVEIGWGDKTSCILDMGTGARVLGAHLTDNHAVQQRDLHIFLSHYHWDHIQGVPFFPPLFDAANQVTFYGSGLDGNPLDLLRAQMAPPFFPVGLDDFPATVEEVILQPEQIIDLGGIRVAPFEVKHTQFTLGFRIEGEDASVVYCTDYEHGVPSYDAVLLEKAAEADLLICDAQYTPEEYTFRHGWGHSTWEKAALLAKNANVGVLALFHHDPSHDDEQLAHILEDAREIFPNTVLATEDETIWI